jgi:nicotinamidase-related amidase
MARDGSGDGERGSRTAVGDHTLTFDLDPRSTALVVVDMQYASACRTTGFGRWLAEQGRANEGRYRFDRIEQLLVPNIAHLLEFFRGRRLDRLFLRLGAELDDCRDMLPHLRDLERAFRNVRGQPEFEILEELAPEPDELVLTKRSASGFTSTGLDAVLRNLETRYLVFTGVSTSQCVDLTARDAADRGYQCVIVEDAVAEDRSDYHEWTLAQFKRLFGRVLTTEQVVAELSARLTGTAPSR